MSDPQFTPEFKARIVLDVLTGVQSQAEVCRKHALSPNLLALWKTTFLERAHTVFASDASRTAEQARIAELEQVLGRITLENEILKKASTQAGLTLDQKRDMMLLLREQYPIKTLCEVLGVPRSSAYYQPRPDEDRPVRDALIELAGQWPTYGYRRLTAMLKRQGRSVNTKQVRRLMHELGIAGEAPSASHGRRTATTPTPGSRTWWRAWRSTRPEQVWVADITYVRLREGVHLSSSDNGCVHASASGAGTWARSLEQELTLAALREGLERGRPEIHHSDQGVQYAATAYIELLRPRAWRSAWRTWANPKRMDMPRD